MTTKTTVSGAKMKKKTWWKNLKQELNLEPFFNLLIECKITIPTFLVAIVVTPAEKKDDHPMMYSKFKVKLMNNDYNTIAAIGNEEEKIENTLGTFLILGEIFYEDKED